MSEWKVMKKPIGFGTAEAAGSICGWIAGLATGFLVTNYIIFPRLIGATLLEVLKLLMPQYR